MSAGATTTGAVAGGAVVIAILSGAMVRAPVHASRFQTAVWFSAWVSWPGAFVPMQRPGHEAIDQS